MCTPEDLKQMMDMLKTQQEMQQQMQEQMQQRMELITILSAENARLQQQNVQQSAPSTHHLASRQKPERPSIIASCSETDWAIFEDSWKRYKRMARIVEEEDKIMELRSCCSGEVNKMLFEFVGATKLNAASLTEDQLMKHIKLVAVKTVHKVIHQHNFHKMKQDLGESIMQFVARLNAQATQCDFTVPCPTEGCEKISYAEQMVSQQLLSGLANADHQARVLSEAGTLKTFQSILDKLVSLETTAESAPQLNKQSNDNAATQAAASKSQYRQSKLMPKDTRCKGCGRSSHAAGKSMLRTDCPSWGKKCDNCGIVNHFKAVCQKTKSNVSATETTENDTPADSSSHASTATFL